MNGQEMRRKDREVTDSGEIRQILEKAKYLHLGLFDEGYPYIVPLHYGYEYEDGTLTFFMHGAKEGHKLDLIRNHPQVCVELECDIELISGGEVPCNYGSSFSSVIARGTAELVEDEAEKIRGLNLLMEHQTGRTFPMDGRMTASVAVIKVKADSFTAKSKKKMG